MPHVAAHASAMLLRHRRRGLLLSMALVATAAPLDLLAGRAGAASLACELGWAAILAVTAWMQTAAAPARADRSGQVAGLAAGVLFSLMVATTGGATSPYFAFATALAPSTLILVPNLPSAWLLTALGTLAGGIAIQLQAGRSPVHVAGWAYVHLAVCLLTGMGGWLHARLLQAEVEAVRARTAAEARRAAEVSAAHAEVTRSRDQLRAILEALPDLVLVSRFDGSVAFVNGRVQSLLGIPPTDLERHTVLDHVVPEDRAVILRRRSEFLAGRTPGTDVVHTAGRGPKGARTFEVNSLRIDFDGSPAMVAVLRDVTERRELEEQLAVAGRLASVGTLAAGVAHELNNPLAYVLTNLRFLSEELASGAGLGAEDRAELRGAADDALQGAERLRRIVGDLLSFTRTSGTPGPVDLRQVLGRAVHLAGGEIRSRARLVTDFEQVPLVQADESRLGQVALNLLANAAQAIPPGHPDEHEIRVTTSTDPAGRAVMEVRDSGAGIPAGIRGRIFEPFFTTRPSGTGLGLSVCHGIVSAMGGEITVESEVGRGSVFRVALPAPPRAASVAA